MQLLAVSQAPRDVLLQNRFALLEDEAVGAEVHDVAPAELLPPADPPVTESEVRNVTGSHDHDLLRLVGKINGRRAVMLIDSGSTHDLISSKFVEKQGIKTNSSRTTFSVTLADGSTCRQQQVTTDAVKVVAGEFGERQTFTVFPLDRYDAILGKPWLSRNNPEINFRTNQVRLGTESVVASLSRPGDTEEELRQLECNLISGKQARRELRKGARGVLAWVSIADATQDTADAPPRVEVDGQKLRDMQNLLKEFSGVLPGALPQQLPPRRFVDHEIELEPGAAPPSRAPYRLPKPEMDELHSQISVLLERGFLEPSKSPFGAPVFFVKKADGSLRMVCDWRDLNKITIKNKACLPNVDDLFDAIQGSTYFSKLDLHSGYNQIRIRKEDIPKTAINTAFGHFQFRVMGFGLTNAPATFQSMMNELLRPYLRKFVVVFLDDILIFSKSWKEHLEHVRIILETLQRHKLFCKPKKCQFAAQDILFLGHKITGYTIAPDPQKIEAVDDWPVPLSVRDVRRFLGFANYFRRFIPRYATTAKPLDEVTGKNAKFSWNVLRQSAFEQLKSALLAAPVLKLADTSRSFRVDTDASDNAIAGVLLQQDSQDEQWHPVAYVSRKLTAAERNYTAAERETLAVVYALESWRMYLFKHFDVITDNMAVLYLRTKPNISKREARWVEFLADYDFTVRHRPGRSNIADPLSRRPDLEVNGLEYSLDVHPDTARCIAAGYEDDSELAPIIQRLESSNHDAMHDRYLWKAADKRLYLLDTGTVRLCIPQGPVRLQLLREHHDCLTAGHPGRDRTYLSISRYFYWPGMSKSVKNFVRSCDRCQRVKGGQTRAGLLQSLPVPERPWTDISMDFIMGLPLTCRGHSAILTFVDRLTKYVHLIPTTIQVDAQESARLYVAHVFAGHGLSKTIVCDRDPRFTSAFFQEVFSRLGVELKMSTANHPQTDGMTERVNRVVEDTLRCFVNHRQNNWDELLPLCEFAINNSNQASTGQTPFFLNTGLDPITPSSLLNPASHVQSPSGSSTGLPWVESRLDALHQAKDAVTAAQARQALYADRGRSEDSFEVGDEVLVFRDYLLTPEARDRPSHKLRLKWYGPFKITQKVAPNAFRLALPSTVKAHPVFNVTALKRYVPNSLPGRSQPIPPPVIDIDGHNRYIVDKVLSHRSRGRQRQYLVKWKGYADATWEPEQFLQDEERGDLIPLQVYKRSAGLH